MKFTKTILITASCFFMTSCICTPKMNPPNIYKPEPNVLNKETSIIMSDETKVILPKGTVIKTDEKISTTVVLEESVKVEVPAKDIPVVDNYIVDSAIKNTNLFESPTVLVSIPKNTQFSLPPNTSISVKETTQVNLEKEAEAVLPKGSEVIISKVNWYAIMFYATVIIVLIWYYVSGKIEDRDGDGYEDISSNKDKKIIKVSGQTYSPSSTSASSTVQNFISDSEKNKS